MKKILSLLLSVALAVSISVLPAAAAEKLSPEENNAQISAQAEALQKKYGINITYQSNADGNASITMNNLETLDRAFSTMSPSLVKQVSQYYKQRNGKRIDINYVFSETNYHYGGVVMAAFERSTSNIYVFLPSKAGQAIISGENPIALVHEFGHAFHLMCVDYYGDSKMLSEWSKFNNGIRYNENSGFFNPDPMSFVSEYASSSFEEDVAETFAHAFVRNVPGSGFKNRLSKDSKMTYLGKKVNYVEKLISAYISEPAQALANYRKIYETSTYTTFEGVKLSGDYLQYSGYPQPKNVLKGILNELDMVSQKSTWVRSIGAWRVVDGSGDMYFIFPGGLWTSAKSGSAAA